MTFLQPAFLWGLLALAIPVLIHLWHQKRAQMLPWATMHWLREASQQQQRGLRFDEWWLLALRCLAIVLLAVLLAKPVWPNADPKEIRHVHLVQPDSLVSAEFRFELDRVRQQNEVVIKLPAAQPLNPLVLQHVIDSLRGPEIALHVYVRNEASLAAVPQISVPQRFSLHAAFSPMSQRPEAAPAKPFAGLEKTVNVRLDYQNPTERQTVLAALIALAQVYALNLNTNPGLNVQPDWILTDTPAKNPNPATLYTISGAAQLRQLAPNVVWVADTLTPQTADWVASGQLPEWLGEQLAVHYKLTPPRPALTEREINRIFVRTNDPTEANPTKRTREQNGLVALLLLVVGAERWLALRK